MGGIFPIDYRVEEDLNHHSKKKAWEKRDRWRNFNFQYILERKILPATAAALMSLLESIRLNPWLVSRCLNPSGILVAQMLKI